MTKSTNTVWSFDLDTVNRWAYAKNVFSPQECQSIIDYGNTFQLTESTVITTDETSNNLVHTNDLEIRKSKVNFIIPSDDTAWIYHRLTTTAMNLNNQFFKFDLFGFAEGLQFTRYDAPSGKYNYHIDKNQGGNIRKLSIILLLSDPSTYEGGDFEILDSMKEEKLLKEQGTVLAMPSYLLHRVTEITKGTRYSLVGWITGNNFR